MSNASFGDRADASTRQAHWRDRWLGNSAITVALTALLATSAQEFCGFYAGKADASLFNEASQVVLVRDGNRTVISMLNDYSGPLNEFALIVPTLAVLKAATTELQSSQRTKTFRHL